jgi:hypothetical protein
MDHPGTVPQNGTPNRSRAPLRTLLAPGSPHQPSWLFRTSITGDPIQRLIRSLNPRQKCVIQPKTRSFTRATTSGFGQGLKPRPELPAHEQLPQPRLAVPDRPPCPKDHDVELFSGFRRGMAQVITPTPTSAIAPPASTPERGAATARCPTAPETVPPLLRSARSWDGCPFPDHDHRSERRSQGTRPTPGCSRSR